MTDKRHVEGASSPADDHSVDHQLVVDLENPVDELDGDRAADDPPEDVDSEVLDVDDLMDAAFPEAKARFSVQLDELMPTTRRALNVLNRVFNYSDRRKNVIVSGNYGTGRGYLIEAWLSNLSALPRLDKKPLHVIRFDAQGLQNRLEQLTGFSDIDLSDILIALFSGLEAVCVDSGQQTVMLMDDADMAAKVLHLVPSLRIVVRLSNYEANRFVLQCRERIKDFDVISMDEYLPTWRELTAEVDRVNAGRFLPRYDDSLRGDVLLDFMRAVWKLDSGGTKSPRICLAVPSGGWRQTCTTRSRTF